MDAFRGGEAGYFGGQPSNAPKMEPRQEERDPQYEQF